jgi:hypothetical protein
MGYYHNISKSLFLILISVRRELSNYIYFLLSQCCSMPDYYSNHGSIDLVQYNNLLIRKTCYKKKKNYKICTPIRLWIINFIRIYTSYLVW